MNITTILIIITVFASVAMIALTLMQTSKNDMGSAFGGGGSQSMFGSRGSSNFLSRATSIMCTIFFVASLALAYIYAQRGQTDVVTDSASVIDEISEVPTIETVAPEIDANSVPTIESVENSVPEVIEPETVAPISVEQINEE